MPRRKIDKIAVLTSGGDSPGMNACIRAVTRAAMLLRGVCSFFPPGTVHMAVVEAADVTPDGEITLTTSVGAANTFLLHADKILLEINSHHPTELYGFHDIFEPEDPPHRREIPLYATRQRCGEAVRNVHGAIPSAS